MNVGELKAALADVPDTLEVVVDLPMPIPHTNGIGMEFLDGFAYVKNATHNKASSISSQEFMIHCGKTYDY